MIIPCGACITLAVCKAKTQIKCEIVYEALRQEVKFDREKSRLGSISEELRNQINLHFPNVQTITGDIQKITFKGFK